MLRMGGMLEVDLCSSLQPYTVLFQYPEVGCGGWGLGWRVRGVRCQMIPKLVKVHFWSELFGLLV